MLKHRQILSNLMLAEKSAACKRTLSVFYTLETTVAMMVEMISHIPCSPSVRRYPRRISSTAGQQKLLRSCPQFQGGLIPPPNQLVF